MLFPDGFEMLIKPKEYLENYSGQPRKSLGQHFLVQPKTAELIVKALDIIPEDIVVEIGPGLGALTKYLIEYPCSLHLVELDRMIAAVLKEHISERARAKTTLHIKDILAFDFNVLTYDSRKKIKVVGNIPYNISSPLLFHLMQNHTFINVAVLMVQREVGERWCAEPGSRAYGIPSVLLACCATREKLCHVGKGQFYPRPKVDSLVVKLHFLEKPHWETIGYNFFRHFVSCLFKGRRKTIMNTLKKYLKTEIKAKDAQVLAEALLKKTTIHPRKRPEQISPVDFVRLAQEIHKIFSEK